MLGVLLFSGAQGQQNEWSSFMDNTIYSEGDLSNGAGDHIISGNTSNGDSRRALLNFNIDNHIPFGATIMPLVIFLYAIHRRIMRFVLLILPNSFLSI